MGFVSLLGLMMVLFLFFSSRFGAGILKEEANKYLKTFTAASLIFNCVYGCYNLNQYLMSEENIISLALGTNIFLFCWMADMFIFIRHRIFIIPVRCGSASYSGWQNVEQQLLSEEHLAHQRRWYEDRRTRETRCEEANPEFWNIVPERIDKIHNTWKVHAILWNETWL